MIMPRYMPNDAYFDDPAGKMDPAPRDDSLAFALAGGGIIRVQEWITRGRGGAKQRGLRSDLVTLCICPHLLPCKRPSATFCARGDPLLLRRFTARAPASGRRRLPADSHRLDHPAYFGHLVGAQQARLSQQGQHGEE